MNLLYLDGLRVDEFRVGDLALTCARGAEDYAGLMMRVRETERETIAMPPRSRSLLMGLLGACAQC